MCKIKYFIAIFCLILLSGCVGDNLNAAGNKVYASDIYFNSSKVTCFKDETFKLNDLGLTVLPLNVTEIPEFSVDNSEIANIDFTNGVLSFKKIGSFNLNAEIEIAENTYKKATLNFEVILKPIYAESITFESKIIEFNYDETAVNKLTILPASFNLITEVKYSTNGIDFVTNGSIVNYDVKSGIITANKAGSEIVLVKVQNAVDSFITAKFDVIVTDNNFATDLNISINNKSNINLLTGDMGEITYEVLPANYNLGIEFSSTNNLIIIDELGKFVVGEETGSGVISVKVKMANEEYIIKTINFSITKPDSSLNFDIYYNNNLANELNTGYKYKVILNNSDLDYSLVTFNNCEFTHISGNEFEIVVNTAGNTNIIAKYTYAGDLTEVEINGNKTIEAFDVVKGINYSLYNETTEIIRENNNYNLYIINNEFVDEALKDKIYNSASLFFKSANLNTKLNALSFTVEGNSIQIINNEINIVADGVSTITISSNDLSGFSISFTITVKSIKPTEIKISENSKTLYIDENNNADNFILEYEIFPKYSVFNDVQITANNENISILNNVVTAVNSGESEITIAVDNICAKINVTVKYVANKMDVSVNSALVENNVTLKVSIGEVLIIRPNLYCNSNLISDCVNVNMTGSTCENINDICVEFLHLTITDYGTTTITFTYENLNYVINILCERINLVTAGEISNTESAINRYLTNSLKINFTIVCEDVNYEPTEKISLFVCNPKIATINSENVLTFIGNGDVTINLLADDRVIDSITINVTYKEIHFINSVQDFALITSGNYEVNSDLDFTNFDTLPTFSGELNFNNHIITNIYKPLFTEILCGAIVKNVNVSGIINYNIGINAIFASTNNGTISDIKFKNLIVNTASDSIYKLSLICNNNQGIIFNISFDNVVANETRQNVKNSNSKISAIAYENHGKIANVSGNINLNKFIATSGIVQFNYAEICNVSLNLNVDAVDNSNISGIAIKSFENAIYKNNNLNITISGSDNYSYGGLIYTLLSACKISDCVVKTNFNSYPNSSNIGLFIFESNGVDIYSCTISNSGYYSVEGYSGTSQGNVNTILEF